jgi:hypothetical protein
MRCDTSGQLADLSTSGELADLTRKRSSRQRNVGAYGQKEPSVWHFLAGSGAVLAGLPGAVAVVAPRSGEAAVSLVQFGFASREPRQGSSS